MQHPVFFFFTIFFLLVPALPKPPFFPSSLSHLLFFLFLFSHSYHILFCLTRIQQPVLFCFTIFSCFVRSLLPLFSPLLFFSVSFYLFSQTLLPASPPPRPPSVIPLTLHPLLFLSFSIPWLFPFFYTSVFCVYCCVILSLTLAFFPTSIVLFCVKVSLFLFSRLTSGTRFYFSLSTFLASLPYLI